MKLVVPSLVLFILFASASAAQVKKPEPALVKAPFSKSLQLVVVTTKDWNTVAGKAQKFERKNETADWKPVDESFPIVVGSSGLAWSGELANRASQKIKQEGDGNSPAGIFPLTAAFGTGTKPSKLLLPYTKLDQYTECVDDVKSSFYNKIVNRMQVGNFDWKSSEKMLAIGEPYGLGVFVGYNSFPVEKAKGSCIFLHIWKNASTGTAGCTAMDRRNIELLLSWISVDKNPYLVQLPEDVYKSSRKSWNLPKLK